MDDVENLSSDHTDDSVEELEADGDLLPAPKEKGAFSGEDDDDDNDNDSDVESEDSESEKATGLVLQTKMNGNMKGEKQREGEKAAAPKKTSKKRKRGYTLPPKAVFTRTAHTNQLMLMLNRFMNSGNTADAARVLSALCKLAEAGNNLLDVHTRIAKVGIEIFSQNIEDFNNCGRLYNILKLLSRPEKRPLVELELALFMVSSDQLREALATLTTSIRNNNSHEHVNLLHVYAGLISAALWECTIQTADNATSRGYLTEAIMHLEVIKDIRVFNCAVCARLMHLYEVAEQPNKALLVVKACLSKEELNPGFMRLYYLHLKRHHCEDYRGRMRVLSKLQTLDPVADVLVDAHELLLEAASLLPPPSATPPPSQQSPSPSTQPSSSQLLPPPSSQPPQTSQPPPLTPLTPTPPPPPTTTTTTQPPSPTSLPPPPPTPPTTTTTTKTTTTTTTTTTTQPPLPSPSPSSASTTTTTTQPPPPSLSLSSSIQSPPSSSTQPSTQSPPPPSLSTESSSATTQSSISLWNRLSSPFDYDDGYDEVTGDVPLEVIAIEFACAQIEFSSKQVENDWIKLRDILQVVASDFLPSRSTSAHELACWKDRMLWWKKAYFSFTELHLVDFSPSGETKEKRDVVVTPLMVTKASCARLIFGDDNRFAKAISRKEKLSKQPKKRKSMSLK